MKTILLPGLSSLALLALGACASMDAPASMSETVPAPVSASPEPLEGYDWHLFVDGGEASLAYGVANTDDVPISLGCMAGDRRIEVIRDTPSAAPAEIHLESGGDTERLAAQVEESMLTGGYMMTAHIAADAPVMIRFRDLGWLAVWDGELRKPYAAHPQARNDVTRFFSVCAGD